MLRILCPMQKRCFNPPLPSILLANIQSLDNKIDKLRLWIKVQYTGKCCVFVFTEKSYQIQTNTQVTPFLPSTMLVFISLGGWRKPGELSRNQHLQEEHIKLHTQSNPSPTVSLGCLPIHIIKSTCK